MVEISMFIGRFSFALEMLAVLLFHCKVTAAARGSAELLG